MEGVLGFSFALIGKQVGKSLNKSDLVIKLLDSNQSTITGQLLVANFDNNILAGVKAKGNRTHFTLAFKRSGMCQDLLDQF